MELGVVGGVGGRVGVVGWVGWWRRLWAAWWRVWGGTGEGSRMGQGGCVVGLLVLRVVSILTFTRKFVLVLFSRRAPLLGETGHLTQCAVSTWRRAPH